MRQKNVITIGVYERYCRHSRAKRSCNPHLILVCLCQSRCHKLTYLGRVMSFSSEMRAFNPVIRKVRLHGCDLVHELTRTQIAMSLHCSRSYTSTYIYIRLRVHVCDRSLTSPLLKQVLTSSVTQDTIMDTSVTELSKRI